MIDRTNDGMGLRCVEREISIRSRDLSMLKCLLQCNTQSKKKRKSCSIPRSSFVNSFLILLCFNRFVEISLQNSAPLISTITILRHRGSCLFSNINARYCHIIYFLLLFRFIFENIARLSERLSLIFIGSGYWIGIREMALKYIYIYIHI